MSADNMFPNSSGSSEGAARSPSTITRERVDIIDHQDMMDLIAHSTVIVLPAISMENDEPSIEVGNTQPAEGVNHPIAVPDNQPIDLDRHHQQPYDQIPYLLSPINEYIANDGQVPLSPGLHVVPVIVNVNVNLPDDDIVLIDRETVGEYVQHEDNDVYIELAETVAIEPVESPVQHEPTNMLTIIEIDLTLDEEDSNYLEVHDIDSNGASSPVTIDRTDSDNDNQRTEVELIDLTGDTDDQEETGSIRMAPDVNHDEQPNEPPVESIAQRLAPATESSAEAADQNPIYSTTTGQFHQTLEAVAQLQVPITLPQHKKRGISSDETRCDANIVPRHRKRRRQTCS